MNALHRNQGRAPPRWHRVHTSGTRCSTDFHSLLPWKVRTTASASVRTLMLPEGLPLRVQEYEKRCPAQRQPSRRLAGRELRRGRLGYDIVGDARGAE